MGRTEQIRYLRDMVRASAKGRFQIGFISGERGIGKSSIAHFVKYISETELNVVGSHVFLGGIEQLSEMVRRLSNQLLKDSIEKSWHEQILDFFGHKVRKVGAFGVSVELSFDDKEFFTLIEHFPTALQNLLSKITADKAGLLLILDDINGLATSSTFANWLKSTVDEISTLRQPFPLCILVVGLEQRRQELLEAQPSLDRVFRLIDIPVWSDEETMQFYNSAFASVNAKVENEGLETLVQFTGGLPVLAHEIGDAVWREAKHLEISFKEVNSGVVNAADIVGQRLLEPQVFSAIRNEKYRSMLRKLAGQPHAPLSFHRKELKELLTDSETKALDHFLRRMRKLGVIVNTQNKGEYQFQNHLHALYFYIESLRAKDK